MLETTIPHYEAHPAPSYSVTQALTLEIYVNGRAMTVSEATNAEFLAYVRVKVLSQYHHRMRGFDALHEILDGIDTSDMDEVTRWYLMCELAALNPHHGDGHKEAA